MSKDMCPRNRPNFNTESRLTPNGGRAAGEQPGSAPESNAAGSPRASRPALRRLFASPETPASTAAATGGSGGPPADVDELVATPGRPGRDVGAVVVELAAAAPAAGVETEASSRPGTAAAGPDVEPDIVPTAGSGVQGLAAADRPRAFTMSPPAGLAAGA